MVINNTKKVEKLEPIRFTMRMDRNLYEQLKELAFKSKRSIAKEIEYSLEQYLKL